MSTDNTDRTQAPDPAEKEIGTGGAEEIATGMAGAERSEHPCSPVSAQPHHPGLGQLLPHGGVLQDLPQAGPLDAPAGCALRPTNPSNQVEGMATAALLGPVEPGEQGLLGIRRHPSEQEDGSSPLPAEVQLVQDRTAQAGQ